MSGREGRSGIGAALRAPALQVKAMLAVAMLFGGGGVGFGLNNLIVQLFAIALLAMNGAAVRAFFRDAPRLLVWLVALSIALPLVQSIPLPPAFWQALPGRELVAESFSLAGLEGRWFSWSVNPWRTLLAALALLPPFTVLALAIRLDMAERRGMLVFLVWLALANLALGAVQVLTGNASGNLYPGAQGPILFGSFANRNSTGLFLAIALAAVLFVRKRDGHWLAGPARFLVAALIVLGVLLTQSRSAFALAAIAALAWALFGPLRSVGPLANLPAGKKALGGVIALALLAGAGALVAGNDRLGATFERFGQTEFNRPEIWEDGLFSARRFWPVGSGVGTFDEVFQVDESLEYLMSERAGRAHNDYLEVAIESGLFGILLIAGWAFLLLRGIRNLRGRETMTARGAMVGLTLIAAQSAIDYPLRNEALLCIAALLLGLIASFGIFGAVRR